MQFIKNYYSPTPKLYRQLGDFCLVLIPFVQAGILNAPNLTDIQKYWWPFWAGIILIAAKFVTNTFKYEQGTTDIGSYPTE